MFAKLGQLLRWQRGRVYERVAESEMAHAHSRAGASCALLSVQGMTCSACSSAVESALRAVAGVSKVEVSLLQHSAEVHFQGGVDAADELVAAVEAAGFDAKLQSVHNVDEEGEGGAGSKPQVARLAVGGMTCGACSGAVERGLLALPGVQHAAVSITQGEAEVSFLPGTTSPEALVAAIEDLGFEAALLGTAGQEGALLAVSGMTCGACSGAVEAALAAVPGVTGAAVNAVTGRAQVWYNPTTTGPRAFLDAVSAAGFEASLLDEAAGGASSRGAAVHAEELATWRHLLSMALVFTVPVFLLAMVLPMVPGTEEILSAPVLGFRCDELLKWALATPVQFWIGWRFHRGAAKALSRGVANMDVLVALGTGASYAYSVISVLHHRFVRHDADHYTPTDFFETCAMLITVVILGKYLECAAKGRTSEAIQALLALAPEAATLVELDEGGHVTSEETISSRLVHHGDLLKVLPGGRIPADGCLVAGCSYINEAMITGESQPVLKQKGDALIGGTINTGNALIMQATRVGADTVLSQIVRLVERAQLSKAPIQAYADYVASLFVPVVVGLALTTWAAWFIAGEVHAYPDSWLPLGHTHFLFALLFGIAVLVIACPCALGLATPTAVMVGTGVGAQLGILIKGGDALERGNNVNTVIFDKTGTLTLGRPQVMEAAVFSRHYTLPQVCELAAAAEASSEHPLARAVLEFAEARLATPAPSDKALLTAWALHGGVGVAAGGGGAVGGGAVALGSPAAALNGSASVSGTGTAGSSRGTTGTGGSSSMHGPRTPPHPAVHAPPGGGAFKAAFSLDDECCTGSGASTPSTSGSAHASAHSHPTHRHPAHTQQQRQQHSGSLSPRHLVKGWQGGGGGGGGGGDGIQLTELLPVSSRGGGSSSAHGSPHASYYGGGSGWARGGWSGDGGGGGGSSSHPSSPCGRAGGRHQQPHHHHLQQQQQHHHHHHHDQPHHQHPQGHEHLDQQQHHHHHAASQQQQQQQPLQPPAALAPGPFGVRAASDGSLHNHHQQQQQQQHHWPRRSRGGGGSLSSGGGIGSPAGTPRQLKHLLAAGLLRVSEVENHPGKGVTTTIPDVGSITPKGGAASAAAAAAGSSSNGSSGRALRLVIGNRLLMHEQGVGLGPEAAAFMGRHEGLGRTCVLVGINGGVVAALAIADPLKPEARGVVGALHAQGIQVHLLTGDNSATAHAIASQLALPSCAVSAEVLPAGKAGVVRELQAAGRVVAMVGDGINDSPALAAADVGMAIGSGTDIAVEAADYVLMRDSLEQVLVALDLSRATFRRIQWNFCWAMVYNLIMIPIAAGLLYPAWRWRMPPWVAGGCMVFSSISVVLSSLLLRRYRPPAGLLPAPALADVRVA